MGDRSFQIVEDQLLKVVEVCLDYYFDIYYFLGVINYMQQDMFFVFIYFQQFLVFKNIDNFRYVVDYIKQVVDVKQVIGELKFNLEFFVKIVFFELKIVLNVFFKEDEYFLMMLLDNMLMFYMWKYDVVVMGDMMINFQE